MPRNDTDVPVEYVDTFTLRIYHSFEKSRFEIEVPELNCKFRATTLADVAANAAQGLLYHLYEREKRQIALMPGRPV